MANWGARISIGDNFYFSFGDSVNPMTSNLQGAVYVEPGAELAIGNNVGMVAHASGVMTALRLATM